MRSPIRFPVVVLGSVLSLIAFTRFAFAVPGTTAFTYQGHLDSSGLPANADFDFRFTLFDAKTAGNAIGTPVEQKNVTVNNGLFTCEITFPITAFDTGADRWIALEVKPAGSGAYVVLDPRQHITRQPYATSALGLSEVLPISRGGTGSSTQSFVDLTTAQTVGEKKTFLKGGVTVTILDPSMGLFSQTTSTGQAGHFKIANAANTSAALEGESNGTGPAVKGTATGTGLAGEFAGGISVSGSILASGGVKFTDNSVLTSASSLVPQNFMIVGTTPTPPTGFTFVGPVNAVQEEWTNKSRLPIVIIGACAVALNGKFYLIGGDGAASTLDSVYEYDPALDHWTLKTPLTSPRDFAKAVVLNGKIYVIGGNDANNKVTDTIFEYDFTTDKWTPKAVLPAARAGGVAGVINGKIYYAGGYDTSNHAADSLYVYDPVADSWDAKHVLPGPRGLLMGGVLNGKLYVVGGIDGGGNLTNTLYAYNPTANDWTPFHSLPYNVADGGGDVINGKLGVVGGGIDAAATTITDNFYEYDPASNSWSPKAHLPTLRWFVSVTALNGQLYAVGGLDDAAHGSNTVYQYTPPVTYYLHRKN